MKKILYFCFDLFIIVCFMLFGMVIAEHNEFAIWIGALSGLIFHRIVMMILMYFRNYIYGGRN